MSNLDKRTGKADIGQPATTADEVAAKKAAARALLPVRNDPQAATHPSDFVKQQIREVDADGNDIPNSPQSDPVETATGVELAIIQKNRDADSKRAAFAESKHRDEMEEAKNTLDQTVRNAETVIDGKDEEIGRKDETINEMSDELAELKLKLAAIEDIADGDEDESKEEKDDTPSAADIAKKRKADATAKAKASAKGKS